MKNKVLSHLTGNTIQNTLQNLFDQSIGVEEMFNVMFTEFLPSTIGCSYPPHNITETFDDPDQGKKQFKIELAVAGFTPDDILITVEPNNDLKIVGEKKQEAETENNKLLYKGIASRGFTRRFKLADGATVSNATVKDGMLVIIVDYIKVQPKSTQNIPLS